MADENLLENRIANCEPLLRDSYSCKMHNHVVIPFFGAQGIIVCGLSAYNKIVLLFAIISKQHTIGHLLCLILQFLF